MAEPQEAGPWDDYAPATSERGPWDDYATEKPADTRTLWERGAVKPTTLTTGDVSKIGEAAAPVIKAFGEGVVEGFGDQPLGPGEKMGKDLRDLGVFPPEGKGILDTGWRAPFYAFNTLGSDAVTAATEVPFRSVNALYRGLQRAGMEAGLNRDVVSIPDAFMGSPHPMGIPKIGELKTNIENALLSIGRDSEAAKKEAGVLADGWTKQEKDGGINLANGDLTATTAETDTRGLARVTIGKDGNVTAHAIGDAPKPEDFKPAANLVADDPARLADTEANLRTLWEERGIHPAEALNDAKNDTWARNELTQPPINGLPPVPSDHIRFFHSGDNPTKGGGRWVNESEKYVTGYREGQSTHYVDVPNAWLDQKFPDTEFYRPTDGTSRVPYPSFEAPEQFAKQMRPVEATEGVPRPGGADVPHDPPYVSPAVEPPPPPGSLLADVRGVVDQVVGLGRNLQYMLDPMATGSPRAMVIAKDAISSVRRIRWEHARRDAQIVKEFSPESWERMWNAMDEESVLRQEGKTSEHMGLETLEPRERLMVEILHEESQAAWLHAVDAGMVEGEGLPAYTPRMVLNVAAASDHVAPQALNELGRNVFTRTAQMKHRKNLLAEETEAAAKELVRAKMEKAKASPEEIKAALEKIQIARNVRAMPLATAKLQEATIWRNMIKNVEDAGKATGSDTVADFNPGKGWFTIAGNPAFTRWAPKLVKEDGKWRTMGDDQGNTIFEAKPIYMRDEFKGPMMSILDEPPGKVVQAASTPYEALMGLKSRTMQLILNSPLIHNAVVWSKVAEASGGREWLGFGLYGKGTRIMEGNPARASELIERGLNPMGPRGSIQDITAIMESPNPLKGHNVSFTGKVAAFVPGLFDPAAGAAVERAISTAGNFWHNTLLWDRIAKVHFGLADHLSDRLVAEGADRVTADRVATHFSNIIVGSIPKEAMSAGARASANVALFSRSFTLGNLSTFKQAAFGLPKPIMAQIARDSTAKLMFERDPKTGEFVLPSEEREAIVQAQIDKSQAFAKSAARSKAMWTVGLSAAMFYIGNAVIQHGFNMALRDETLDDQLRGYARRYKEMMDDVKGDPLELRHMLERLSPTYDNEPNKQDRIHIGFDKDGTAIYARNPTGKFGEELIGYPTKPMAMLRAKLNPTLSAFLDIYENDKGFGHKVYDEHDKSTVGDVAVAIAVAKHIVMKHLPEQQIAAAGDLLMGDGDTKVNAMRLLGPMAGFSASVGSPKGMAGGEAFAARQELNARFDLNWPMIKRQIQRGDTEGAQQAMEALRIPPMMQRGLMRSAMNPGAPLRGRTLREFYQSATPHQIERFERAPRAPETPQQIEASVPTGVKQTEEEYQNALEKNADSQRFWKGLGDIGARQNQQNLDAWVESGPISTNVEDRRKPTTKLQDARE